VAFAWQTVNTAQHLITVHVYMVVDRILMVSANTFCTMIPCYFDKSTLL